ncbi:Gluconate transport-inducing protein [Coemansia sp. RSA 1933]|nr:Gluconate transport-inducing protein [Coemansia sp. RSA 1933]
METYYGFVSTSEDALALFEACRLGYKQRVTRRLSDSERGAIRSGSVFVWEEGESGMKRWTDGRSWSPSRVQGCFLTYHEWEGRRRAQRHPSYQAFHGFSMPMNIHGMSAPVQSIPMGIARYGHFIGGPTKAGSTQVQYGFPKENGMLKKALSIRTTEGKKLHLIAYYSKEDHAKRRLLTPTTDANFPKLVVPPNLYPDMSPESMYGASHATASRDANEEPDSATADGNMFAYAQKTASLASTNSSSSNSNASGTADNNGSNNGGGKMHKEAAAFNTHQQQHATVDSRAEAMAVDGPQDEGMMHSSADDEYVNSRYLAPRNPIPVTSAAQPNYTRRHLRQPSPLRLSGPHQGQRLQYPTAVSGGMGSADCVDVISDRLHRARVQSLVIDSADVPSPLHSAAISRPAPEHGIEQGGASALLRYPHSAHPMNNPAVVSTRPSSNSFSGEVFRSYGSTAAGGGAHIQAQLGLPRYEPPRNDVSSSSAPSSTLMRPSKSSSSATVPSSLPGDEMYHHSQNQHQHHHQPPMISEATLMQAHAEFIDSCAFGPQQHKDGTSNYAKTASDGNAPGGGRTNRYLGLNGPLGLSGSAGVRRSTPLRLATSATVIVRSPCAEPLSEKELDGSQTAHPMSRGRRSGSSTLPLLLSPLALSSANSFRHQSLATAPASAMGFEASLSQASTIQLAGIHRDVKEGPRRLPSISASIRDDLSPQETSAPLCSPGGLGIYSGSALGLRVPSSSSLLPSPLPTPRQSLPRGFDGDRLSPRKSQGDSLSILASAADRTQVRHASISHRSAAAAVHHPYSRSALKRGPTMRSVSLKQSEDIRQLGILDQGLRLK